MDSYAPTEIRTQVSGLKVLHTCLLYYGGLVSVPGVAPGSFGLQPIGTLRALTERRPNRESNSGLKIDSLLFFHYTIEAMGAIGIEPTSFGLEPNILTIILYSRWA